jgi:hypothetical protein
LHIVSHGLAWLLVQPIVFYQKFITPYTPPSCRFTPTCSEYARQAILKHGPVKGLLLSHLAHPALQSLGWQRLRSGAIIPLSSVVDDIIGSLSP